MKIIQIAPTVKKILIDNPETRDSDELLILKVWAEQNPSLRMSLFTFRRFAKSFIKGDFANTESIRRSRQKIQQEFPKLRGESYKPRHKERDSVKEQLRSPEVLAGGTP